VRLWVVISSCHSAPDGRFVAVPTLDRHREKRVALVDLTRRRAALVARAARGDYQVLAWSPRGWLSYNAGHRQIAAYRPGVPRSIVLPEHVPPLVDHGRRLIG
jgi:hypothetical protein